MKIALAVACRLLAMAATMLAVTACNDDGPRLYSVAGAVSGLSATGLVLRNNGADDTSIAANATSFQFARKIQSGAGYSISVAAQPAALTCTVSNGKGTNVHEVVTTVSVTCSPITYTIAGAVSGLTANDLVLQNNGADNLTVAANDATFRFETPVAVGGGYNVSVFSQPSGRTCTVSNGVGANVLADVTGVQVTCSPSSFSIGGTVTGLTGAGLVLRDNGADDLALSANSTTFQFATPVAADATYTISIWGQPTGQTCSVSQPSGVAASQVTTVAVTCADIITYTLSASSGANGSIAPSGAVTVNTGASQGFVATPAASYTVGQWFVDGTPVQTGGDVYTISNVTANHTVSVTFGHTTLSTSVSNLALSVDCQPSSSCATTQNPALTGNSRRITITNTGTDAATNVAVGASALPSGTSEVTTCGSTLTSGASCTITITPGAQASSSCTTGIAPIPGVITIGADNAASSDVNTTVLGYGCIYQGGYVFAIDDTTPDTGSIGGKVAATTDQSAGVTWSFDGVGNVSNIAILGIDETSTATSPSPTSPAYPVGTPAYTPCDGSSDGKCNSSNIVSYYNFNRAAGGSAPTPSSQYAAGVCTSVINGYSDWYLPAVCEMGYTTNGLSCGTASSPFLQNMQSNLVDTEVAPLRGFYYSSTEYSGVPSGAAQGYYFADDGSNVGFADNKWAIAPVRCTRALTD
jgi:RNase P/RNase MRP subunit p29